MEKRPVIVHFHLFKNAGTSVDRILQKEFGDRWVEIEGPDGRKLDTATLIEFIRNNSQYDAISSHTAVVSVPVLEDIEIIPIFFFRHPIDRIRSAYDFEKKQDASTPGAKMAKQGNFEHYLDWRLSSDRPWQVTNFQAFRLKDYHEITPAKQTKLIERRAKLALEALPFVGLVEDFEISMSEFEGLIRRHFRNFNGSTLHENRTAESKILNDNLSAFVNRIGQSVYDRLIECNKIDMDLYEVVKKRIKLLSKPN